MALSTSLFRKLFWPAFLIGAVAASLPVIYVISVEGLSVRLAAAWFLALAAVLAVAGLLSAGLVRRVARLRGFAEGLLEGRFWQVPLREPADELGALAGLLNALGGRLRQAVSGLSAEAERREAILAGMTEGVLAVDQTLSVVFCNEAFARLMRAEPSAWLQRPVENAAPDPTLIEMLRGAVISKEVSRRRLSIPGPLGVRVFEVHAAPFNIQDRRGAVAVFHDMTELERLERVRRDFVANVSHELRTPLTAIQGYAETLLEGALEDLENNRRFVEIIKAHAIRLNNIASDLLTLAELDPEKPPPPPEPVSVRAVIETALRTIETEARLRGIVLVRGTVSDCTVLGDKTRVEQALVNLLDNAMKFNRPGGQARIDSTLEDGKVRIAVTDNGIGIPPVDLPRIFERFYRVDKARSREVGGTGLGLSIVKHLVERMNGTVTVESRLGEGSIFTIVLPSI
jgi:two-component system phosphate regulon sensor histidine kinase PhoR